MARTYRGRLCTRLRTWLLRKTYALPLDLFRVLSGLLCVAYFAMLIGPAEILATLTAYWITPSYSAFSG